MEKRRCLRLFCCTLWHYDSYELFTPLPSYDNIMCKNDNTFPLMNFKLPYRRQSWKHNNTCYFFCEISGNFVANLSTVQSLLIRQSCGQHNLKYFRTPSLWLGSKISWSGFIYLDHLRYMAYIKVQTATFTNFWINKSPLFNLIVN